MDTKEKFMTEFIKELIRDGVIVFTSSYVGGLTLGPAGIPLGSIASAFLLMYYSRTSTSWEELRNVATFSDLIWFIVKFATKYAIENFSLLVEMALWLAKFIENCFSKKKMLS